MRVKKREKEREKRKFHENRNKNSYINELNIIKYLKKY